MPLVRICEKDVCRLVKLFNHIFRGNLCIYYFASFLDVSETDGLEEVAEFIGEYAKVLAPLAIITAITPAPLPRFPPLGLPQPAITLSGRSNTGGGFTPAAALVVWKYIASYLSFECAINCTLK